MKRNPTYERWRWQIFAITWLAYAGFYLTRKSFSVAKIGIEKDLGMTERQMAIIDGVYLAAYAIGQFLFGMAGDRLGTRIVIICGMIASIIAGFAMGASTMVLAFGVFFCIQGLAQSTGWAPLVKNISAFFSRKERGTVMGLWCTNYALGGLIASVIAGWAGDYFGWRYAFFIPAAGLAFVAVLFFFFQRNRPEDLELSSIEEYHGEPVNVVRPGETANPDRDGSWKTIWAVMTNPMVLLLASVYFLLKPTRYAILFWGPKYINTRLGSGMTESGILSALFELAGPLAAFAGGVISDRVFKARRMPVCVICLFLLAVTLFVFHYLPPTRLAMGAGFFLIGLFLFAPDSLVVGAAAVDFGTKKGASTASGLINGCGSVAAIFGGTLPGFFNDRWGWSGVFRLLAFMSFLAGVILLPRWNAMPAGAKPRESDIVPTQPEAAGAASAEES